MQIQNIQKQKGFTLVEIAIVLVIIGLLLGGVLKGQELITNAKIKAVTSDFDNISAAFYAYKDRTGRIAGDSDGNGTADSNDLFWFNLKTEGFIKGALGTSTASPGPTHDLDGSWVAYDGAISGTMFPTNYICADLIQDNYAHGMDTKMDDGVATTGTVRSGSDQSTAVAYTDDETVLSTVCREL